VLAVFADIVPDAFGLCPVHIVLPKAPLDAFKVLLESLLGAVVIDEVLEHIARKLIHPGVEREPLVDDLARKDLF